MLTVLVFIATTIFVIESTTSSTQSREPFYTSGEQCLREKCLADPKVLCEQYCRDVGYYLTLNDIIKGGQAE